MLYEQRTYHAMPGRLPDLLTRFQAVTLPIWARLGIREAGFWTYTVGGSNHDLIYFLVWDSLAEREERWAAFSSDPEWQQKRRESEQNGPLVQSLTNAFLSPTAFSAVEPPKAMKTPRQVLERFYDAEQRYMAGSVSFEETFGQTLAPDVALHQSPDLPWGGEYIGFERYEEWAAAMSGTFSSVDIQDAEFFETGDKVVVICRLVTRTRSTGVVMDYPMAQVVTVRNGKITDFRPFYWNVPDYAAAQC